VGVLKRVPPLPGFVMDAYMSWRVGSTPPAVPQIDYVSFHDGAQDSQRIQLESLPAKAANVVRLVIISDTHERHRQVSVPAGDVLLHCGDILMSSSMAVQSRGLSVLRDFNEWLATVPCEKKVVIGGNHDTALMKLGEDVPSVITNAVVLDNTAISLQTSGFKVYGNPYSRGDSHNRAWQTPEPSVSDACMDADIILSHHWNDKLQSEVLSRCRPLLWAYGHVHRSHGVRIQDGTLFVNAAVMDSSYNPSQPPFVVDLMRKSST